MAPTLAHIFMGHPTPTDTMSGSNSEPPYSRSFSLILSIIPSAPLILMIDVNIMIFLRREAHTEKCECVPKISFYSQVGVALGYPRNGTDSSGDEGASLEKISRAGKGGIGCLFFLMKGFFWLPFSSQ